jgi:hypothetical protein
MGLQVDFGNGEGPMCKVPRKINYRLNYFPEGKFCGLSPWVCGQMKGHQSLASWWTDFHTLSRDLISGTHLGFDGCGKRRKE